LGYHSVVEALVQFGAAIDTNRCPASGGDGHDKFYAAVFARETHMLNFSKAF
jgi:hypothetical protein